jgi:hypothetical protein
MRERQIERAAYLAAHAINTANLSAPYLACPGARQTHKVDVIAKIIKDVFEAMDDAEQPKSARDSVSLLDFRVSQPVSRKAPIPGFLTASAKE